MSPEQEVDDLLFAFEHSCAKVIRADDSQIGASAKERAILRNEIRRRLLAAGSAPTPETPAVGSPPSGPR
jgi:hypothetical protein